MLFNSQTFILAFLPVTLAGWYALAERRAWRQAWVIAASLVFYAWWDVRYVPLLAGLTLANWLAAQAFGRWRHPAIPLAGVALNLAVLGLFKYADFVMGGLDPAWRPWRLALPLGISFFVFQKISYLVDLKRGDRHIYGFLDFCMFVTFFPQLIAGPLVRHDEIVGQFALDPRRPAMWENLSRGAVLFVIGLAKKAVLADALAPIADPLFARAAGGAALNGAEAWTAAVAYALQIYFDFSGYSDMAIGLALMFGLTLPVNFDAPYRAVSVRDFWRRWHFTLSRFLRDYVYIPLGGNRDGAARQAANVVATMLLGGLWHGASWTFVAWGGLHGIGLAANHVWSQSGLRLPRPLAWAATTLFVIAAWVLFRAPDFATAGRVLASMAGAHGVGHAKVAGGWVIAAGAAAAVIGPTSQAFALGRLRPLGWVAVPAGAALAGLVLLVGGRLQAAFIYFQF